MAEAQIIYFHGLPGSADELGLFGEGIKSRTDGFHVVARTGSGVGHSAADYFAQLADEIRHLFPGVPLHLIGFSLGASAALRTAPHLGAQVHHIDLVSAAAPLDLGDYLDSMAGAPVFRMAAASPLMFGLMTRTQAAMARWLPAQMFRMLFATAQGADRALAESPAFRAAMQQVLRAALNEGFDGYRREILHYVRDWSALLAGVDAPVAIFHGEEDNWSPPAMADDLAHKLSRCVHLEKLPGLSHYSALQAYLSQH